MSMAVHIVVCARSAHRNVFFSTSGINSIQLCIDRGRYDTSNHERSVRFLNAFDFGVKLESVNKKNVQLKTIPDYLNQVVYFREN